METNTRSSTKDKILHLLKKEGILTVNELTELLDITHMAVRNHLSALEKEGFIVSELVKQPMGRPLQTFSLSEKAESYFPKNYEGISIEFLHDIKELYGIESINHVFNKREERLTKEYTSRMQDKSVSEKVSEISKIQNEKGYMTDVTQIDDTTFELTEYNCPILSVANEFKLACHCETAMFKNVLGSSQVLRTHCRTEGDKNCKFLFKFNEIDSTS
ncbi:MULTISPECIES: metalloregulator ArsR/SmtB family transcription factor [unclassified Paenibacillus]|uniref:Helix-turn-helix transcriptional regulator n=1 Tax=Paenibacillus provencensis TaxID=441151 RepID=A0ABW3PVB2_9BACL|nr:MULTISPECIES: metalloregulator ArsR/SmtB family transcription factor [unclassified Paenibacillus]MCM3127166.1 transcriptional regulator [Paenibacillus sp. MER 78]SFS55427.1 Predicted transcriptional regulator, ArsR family [Paenibacillus sp. 453mf]